MNVYRSIVIEAPIDRTWAAVREFDSVGAWNPAVTAARMETGTSTAVGSVRHLDIADGTIFRETLLAHSDVGRFYTYDIVEGPLPCTNYLSTHRFIPITEGNWTLGIWEGAFDCAREDEAKLESIVGDLIYRDGMKGLAAWLRDNS